MINKAIRLRYPEKKASQDIKITKNLSESFVRDTHLNERVKKRRYPEVKASQ